MFGVFVGVCLFVGFGGFFVCLVVGVFLGGGRAERFLFV